MLFGVITGPSLREAAHSLHRAAGKVEGIEFRLDLLDQADPLAIEELLDSLRPYPFKVLFTLRPTRQGGQFAGTEEQRLNLLQEFCHLQPDYVDLEYDVPLAYWRAWAEQFPGIQFICSFHDLTSSPHDLPALCAQISNPYAHIYKIAVTAETAQEGLAMFHFVRAHQDKGKLIGIAMGEAVTFSRVLGPLAGNYFDYASIAQHTAPGQLSLEELRDIYRHSSLDLETAVYGLIGFPVAKSLGHHLHNALFAHYGRNAVYVKIAVQSHELCSFVPLIKQLPFQGWSVTMPFKEAILPFLDALTPAAQAIGAVNTILFREGKWIGHNTDGVGALNAMEQRVLVRGKHVVIIGAGGAGKAIAYEAIQRGADVTLLNRTASRAAEIANRYSCRGGDFSLFPEVLKQGYDILIHATPHSDLIEEQWILPSTFVMDIVYVPRNTSLLVRASKKNCTVIYGDEMWIGQAIEQQQMWFPEQDRAEMRRVIEPLVIQQLE